MSRVSLVIPAYNAEKTIRALLDSIDRQSLPSNQYEVIAVDDGSTDSTPNLIGQHPRIRLVRQGNSGPGAARNRGTKEASGDIIAYTDSDCILPPNWLERHQVTHEEHPEIDGLLGGVAPAYPMPLGSALLADHLCSWFNAHAGLAPGIPEYMPSANISVKRRVFDAGVGWSEKRITGEDVDFSMQMVTRSMQLRFFPDLFLYHVDRGAFREFLHHQQNWGFHAPFVRGRNRKAKYGFLFPPSMPLAYLFTPLIVAGYTTLVVAGWWRSRPLGLMSVLPLIILGKLAYARGVLQGTKALLKGLGNGVADRRLANSATNTRRVVIPSHPALVTPEE